MKQLARDIQVNLNVDGGGLARASATLEKAAAKLGAGMQAGLEAGISAATAMQTATRQLGNALGGLKQAAAEAAAPIALTLAPVLEALVNAATRAVQAIGRLTAGIFGGAFGFAQIEAGAEGTATALKKTGSAAKSVKKDLAAFDKLDVLTYTGGGAQGGGGETTPPDTGEWQLFSTLLDGIKQRLQALVDYIQGYYAPALAAWGAAFATLRDAAAQCIGVVATALQGLWDGTLAPLGAYLLTEFIPSIVNALSTVLAPILAEVGAAVLLQIGEGFAFACDMAARAVQDILLPVLALIETVFTGVMEGVETAWNEYGGRILEAFELGSQKLRELVEAIYTSIIKPVADAIITLLERVWEDTLKPLWNSITLMAAALVETLLHFWNEVLQPFLLWLVEKFGPIIIRVVETLGESWRLFIGGVGELVGGFIDMLRGLLEFLSGIFTGDWERAWDGLALAVQGVWRGIGGFIKGIINGIIALINGMLGGIAGGINAVVGAINSLSITIPDWVPGLGGGVLGFSLPTVTPPQIPYLATGAVIPPNREFLAVLGDQKSGTNIETPEALLRGLLREELAGLQGGGDVNIRFTGSLAALARVLRPEIEKEAERRGTALVVKGGAAAW